MNILHLTWGHLSAYGGIESHIATLAKALEKLGHKLSLRLLPSSNIYHHAPNASRRLPLLGFASRLKAILRDDKIDIIHSHNLHRPHGIGIGDAVLAVARQANIPHLLTVHDVGSFNEMEKASAIRILKGAKCITTSSFNKELISKIATVEANVIPPAICFDEFCNCSEPEPNTIAYPGRLVPGKGHLQAIPILGMISHEIGPLTLLFSDPNRNSYGERIEFIDEIRFAIERFPRLRFEFLQGTSAVPDIYQKSRLTLFMPLMIEGFGLVPMESLACSRPTISTPTGGMEWLQGVPGSVTIESRHILHTAEAVADVLLNWKDWRLKAQSGRDFLKTKYDVSVTAQQHATIYEALVS